VAATTEQPGTSPPLRGSGAADALVLLRHGQSQANADGLFTGLLDVPLTDIGRAEAAYAAHLLNDAEMWPQVCFCSPLVRATQTAAILQTDLSHAPARTVYDWRLAERNYGALTGCTKEAVRAEHGELRFRAWRRSVHTAPPPMSSRQRQTLGDVPEALGLTESLHDVMVRVDAAWQHDIKPAMRRYGSVLLVAHGNSLRALCTILDALTDSEVEALNLPTGHPLVYRFASSDQPLTRGGEYLDPPAARIASAQIAREGGT
jgi:2,3-bisphosphoglycerate-dependent phosphoglycerate mutase